MTGGRHLNLAAVIIITAILLSPIVAAGLIVVAPLNGVVSEVQPPVVLEKPADTSVNATIGPNQTSANITVNVPSGYVISLASRAAVYWNNFDTEDPLANGDFTPLNNDTCTWTWDSTDGYLVGYDYGTSAYYGGECILMLNRYIPPDKPVYVDVNFEWADVGAQSGTSNVDDYYIVYSDIPLLNSTLTPETQQFYTIGNYLLYRDYYGYQLQLNSGATVYYYDGSSWQALNVSNVNYNTGQWYDLLGVRNNTNGSIAEYEGSSQLVSATDNSLVVDRVGLSMYVASYNGYVVPYEVVYYDSLVVTVGRPPYYVQVYGLQPGDKVYILDENGNTVAQATALGQSVSINFWNIKMLRNGTIEVYDSNGYLIAENTFDWIVEGDIYVVQLASLGSIFNILNFASNDSNTTYLVGMSLASTPTITGGTLNSLEIWVETGGNTSYPIYVNSSGVVSSATSALYLYPLYPGQVYLYWNATVGTSVEMSLKFVYYVNGTIVLYPVNLTVRS